MNLLLKILGAVALALLDVLFTDLIYQTAVTMGFLPSP